MSGFDMGSIGEMDLNELLDDHQADFNAYLAQRVCVTDSTVTYEKQAVRRWETPISMMSDGHRSAKHAPGSPSPKGNTEFGTRGTLVSPYSWSEGINHLAKKSVQDGFSALSDLSGKSGHQVLGSLDNELASVLAGNGTADDYNDLTNKSVSNAWDTANGLPVTDIDDVVDALRPGSTGLICIAGWDVLKVLTKNAEMVNHADKDFIGYQDVMDTIMNRGVDEVFIDRNVAQDGEGNFTRSYKGLFDGVFYIGTARNLILGQVNPLQYDVYEDKDSRMEYFRAAGDWGLSTGYAEHGYYFSSILT